MMQTLVAKPTGQNLLPYLYAIVTHLVPPIKSMNHLNQHTSILLSLPQPGSEAAALTWLFSQVPVLTQFTTESPNLQPLNLPGEVLTIEAIRSLSLDLAHFGLNNGLRVFVLHSCELMTVPAQHALLKSLEEPPENVLLVLCTTQPSKLLPTVLSRCQLYSFFPSTKLAVQESLQPLLSWQQLATESYPDLITLAEQLKDRDQAKTWLQHLLQKWLDDLEHQTATPTRQAVVAVRHLETALRDLTQNVNVKLALEHCFFCLKQEFATVT